MKCTAREFRKLFCPRYPFWKYKLQSASGCYFSFDLQIYIFYGDRKQDEELDDLSESVRRIGGVGLTIHDELTAQVTV